jgi:hypothetical protein
VAALGRFEDQEVRFAALDASDQRHDEDLVAQTISMAWHATFFGAPPGSWSTRGDDAIDRKSARIQRDYEIAAMMTAALRASLAHMKQHRPISEMYRPHHGDSHHRTHLRLL